MPSRREMYSKQIIFKEEACLMLFNTDLERSIGLGKQYPYEELESG